MEVLKHAMRQASLGKGLGHLLDDGGCLRGWLEDNRVAGEKSGNQRIDQDEIGVLV